MGEPQSWCAYFGDEEILLLPGLETQIIHLVA